MNHVTDSSTRYSSTTYSCTFVLHLPNNYQLGEYKLIEKRNHPRAAIDLPVELRFLPQDTLTTGRMREISLNGTACFLSDYLPIINTGLILKFSLIPYQVNYELNLQGTVNHVLLTSGEYLKEHRYPYLIGVEFVEMSSEESSLLEELCIMLG